MRSKLLSLHCFPSASLRSLLRFRWKARPESTCSSKGESSEEVAFDKLSFLRLRACFAFLGEYVKAVNGLRGRNEQVLERFRGLFRVPGGNAGIEELKVAMKETQSYEEMLQLLKGRISGLKLEEQTDFMNVVSSLVKWMLVSLPVPLFSYFVATEQFNDSEEESESIDAIVEDIIDVVKENLAKDLRKSLDLDSEDEVQELTNEGMLVVGDLLNLLSKIRSAEIFKMTSKNLLLVFIPSLCNTRINPSQAGDKKLQEKLQKEVQHFLKMSSNCLQAPVNMELPSMPTLTRFEVAVRLGENFPAMLKKNETPDQPEIKSEQVIIEEVNEIKPFFDISQTANLRTLRGQYDSEENQAYSSIDSVDSIEQRCYTNFDPERRRNVNIGHNKIISEQYAKLTNTENLRTFLRLLSKVEEKSTSESSTAAEDLAKLLSKMSDQEKSNARQMCEFAGKDFKFEQVAEPEVSSVNVEETTGSPYERELYDKTRRHGMRLDASEMQAIAAYNLNAMDNEAFSY